MPRITHTEIIDQFQNNLKKAGTVAAKAVDRKPKHTLSRCVLKTLGDVESAIFRHYGIRVVFRVNPKKEHGTRDAQLAELCAKLESEFTPIRNVARFKALLSLILVYYPYKGQKDLPRKLLPSDIVVMSKNGMLAGGNTLLQNVRYEV